MPMNKDQTQQYAEPHADPSSNVDASTTATDSQNTDNSSAGAIADPGGQNATSSGVSSTTGLGLLDVTAANIRSEPLKEQNEQAKNVIAHRMLWGQHEKMHNSITVKQDGTVDFNDDVDEWF